jgi:DUF971 family protein
MTESPPPGMPRALRLHAQQRVLEIEWEDGAAASLPHRLLRERCPCAQCRQSRKEGNAIVAGTDVFLLNIEPYGPNAVHLTFSDGHGRGIFPFSYLRELEKELAGAQPGAAGA